MAQCVLAEAYDVEIRGPIWDHVKREGTLRRGLADLEHGTLVHLWARAFYMAADETAVVVVRVCDDQGDDVCARANPRKDLESRVVLSGPASSIAQAMRQAAELVDSFLEAVIGARAANSLPGPTDLVPGVGTDMRGLGGPAFEAIVEAAANRLRRDLRPRYPQPTEPAEEQRREVRSIAKIVSYGSCSVTGVLVNGKQVPLPAAIAEGDKLELQVEPATALGWAVKVPVGSGG